MKHLYLYIVGLLLFFNTFAYAQPKIVLPDDFHGTATISKVESINSDETESLTTEQIILIAYEVGSYIAEKYTLDEVISDDFVEVLRSVFPHENDNELEKRHIIIRNIYATYDFLKATYNKYVEKFITPSNILRVRSYEDFDHPDDVQYIETKENHFIKVYNFRKFLTYSTNKDERLAIDKYLTANKTDKNFFDYFDEVFHKIDWKKVWFYGSVFDNPLLSKNGVNSVQKGKNVTSQLLSMDTAINGQDELYFGYLLQNNDYSFILANNLNIQHIKPQIDLSGSENVAEYSVLYPAPLNAGNLPFAHKYFGNFLLPFKVKLIDKNKPVKLNAKLEMTTCTTFYECTIEHFQDEMVIETKTDDIFSNGYDNIFANTLKDIPQSNVKQLKLVRFVVDTLKDEQVLRLEFESSEKIKTFKVFIEELNGFTKFESPYINLQDNKVYARFEAFPNDRTEDFINSEFIITAVLNGDYYYRDKVYAKASSEFDPQKPNLNLGLLFLAVLGGFILNFMPCVFPVLSLKIMILSQTKNLRKKAWRKTLLSTMFGIFCGFTILIAVLLIAKYCGKLLGWGMQFQNIGFLVVMIFTLSCFTALLPLLNFSQITQFTSHKQNSKLNFFIGNLIVLLSTPCTGPYLATAIGFAFSGTYTDIVCILYAVALGLSLPYIIVLFIKDPQAFLPKSGKWLNILDLATKCMLYLTLLWFFALLLGQTGWSCLLKILALLLIFLGIFHIYNLFIDYLRGVKDISQSSIQKIHKGARIFIFITFSLFLMISVFIANKAYKKQYEQNISQRQTKIDKTAIQELLKQGYPVLVEIKADWCMTCQVNNILMFNKMNLERLTNLYNLKYIQVDWTNYDEEILKFMSRYGRKGLPFYVLYTPLMREGIVLPEIFTNAELEQFIQEGWSR